MSRFKSFAIAKPSGIPDRLPRVCAHGQFLGRLHRQNTPLPPPLSISLTLSISLSTLCIHPICPCFIKEMREASVCQKKREPTVALGQRLPYLVCVWPETWRTKWHIDSGQNISTQALMYRSHNLPFLILVTRIFPEGLDSLWWSNDNITWVPRHMPPMGKCRTHLSNPKSSAQSFHQEGET